MTTPRWEGRGARVRPRTAGVLVLLAVGLVTVTARAGGAGPGTAPTAAELEAAARDRAPPPADPGPSSVDPTSGVAVEGAGIVPFFGLLLNQDFSLSDADGGLTLMVNPFGVAADTVLPDLAAYQRWPAFVRRAQFAVNLPVSEAALVAREAAVDRITVQLKAELLGRTDRRARTWNGRYDALREEAAARVAEVLAGAEQDLLRVALERRKARRALAALAAGGGTPPADPQAAREELEAEIGRLEREERRLLDARDAALPASLSDTLARGYRDLHAEIARQAELSVSVAGSWRFLDPVTREETRGFVVTSTLAGRFQLVGTTPIDLVANAGFTWSRAFASERALAVAAGFEARLGGDRIPTGPVGLGLQVAADWRPSPMEGRRGFSWSLTELISLPVEPDKHLRLALTQADGAEEVRFNVGFTWVPGGASAGAPLPLGPKAGPADASVPAAPPPRRGGGREGAEEDLPGGRGRRPGSRADFRRVGGANPARFAGDAHPPRSGRARARIGNGHGLGLPRSSGGGVPQVRPGIGADRAFASLKAVPLSPSR